MPHCDPDVLHSPGTCEICDEYAAPAQKWRLENGVNFTDHHDPTKKTCPARARRWNTCQSWSGNRPWKLGTCEKCGEEEMLPGWKICQKDFLASLDVPADSL